MTIDPRSVDSAEADRLAELLGRKLIAIRGDELRAKTAGDELSHWQPAVAAMILGRLARSARDSKVAATTLAAVSRALARGSVDPDHVAATLACARSRADRLVEALLAVGPAVRVYDKNDEQFIDPKMRALPLGQRRALSRTKDVDLLVRLAHDQDPRVIRELLTNPRTTEREAIVVASRRPTHAHVIECVLASRFGNSRRVRRAIAHNPYSSVAQAVRALATLATEDLRQIAADEHVSPQVRRHARSLKAGRGTTPAERAEGTPNAEITESAEEILRQLGSTEDLEVEVVPLDDAGFPVQS